MTSQFEHGTARSCRCTGSVWKPVTGVLHFLNHRLSSLRLNCSSAIWYENCNWCTSIFSIFSTIIRMFSTITSLVLPSTETSIDFYDLLITSSSSSGDFSTSFSSTRGTSSVWPNPCSFQPAVTISQLELICHHLHQLGNTGFSNLITRTGFRGFSDSSFSIARTIRAQHCLLLALLFLSWVLGSHPWLFFLPFKSHLARVPPNLRLTP